MLRKLTRNARKPQGFWGRLMIRKMNLGHAPLTEWALAEIPFTSDDSVLDVGCGGGKTVRRLLKTLPQGKVYGIDYSPLAVEMAKKENRKAVKTGRVEIMQGSVSLLPFPADCFDVVTAVETIYFWPDLPRDFKEIYRVLRPGGHFAVICEMMRGNDEEYQEIETLLKMRVPAVTEVESQLREADFASIKTFVHPRYGWFCLIGEKPLAPDGLQKTR